VAVAGWVPLLAVFGLVQMAISGLTGLLIVHVILSWTQTRSPIGGVVDRLCAPMLAPFRKIIPLVGGIDLSPLALLVVLQVAAMVLASIQLSVLR
jgi:YggT family protein